MNRFTEKQLKQLKTPCFIIDEDELAQNFDDFKQALCEKWGNNSAVAYSVKTNPHPLVLEVAKDCNCMAEVVSDDEYSLALNLGFYHNQIVFNGPCKSKEYFVSAFQNSSIVNIDSKREIRWLKEIDAASKNTIKVGIRINIDMEKFCPGDTIGGYEPGRFGFSFEDGGAVRVLKELNDLDNVKIAGLHLHVTTYSRKPYVYEILACHARKFIEMNDIAPDIDYIDIGGGFYGGGPQNAGKYNEYASVISNELKKSLDPKKVKLIVEPGGAVVCTPGYYLGRVLDVKDIRGKRFVVSELSRLCVDHEQKKDSYSYEIYSSNKTKIPIQRICGYTCLESDRLCFLENEVELSEGDMILIRYAGAYSWSFVPGFFISNPPTVYDYSDNLFREFCTNLETFPICTNDDE